MAETCLPIYISLFFQYTCLPPYSLRCSAESGVRVGRRTDAGRGGSSQNGSLSQSPMRPISSATPGSPSNQQHHKAFHLQHMKSAAYSCVNPFTRQSVGMPIFQWNDLHSLFSFQPGWTGFRPPPKAYALVWNVPMIRPLITSFPAATLRQHLPKAVVST